MSIGTWWRKNVIEKVHAAAYSGRYTITNPWLLNAVKFTYFCIPVVVGMGIMSSVTEGGYFHQGAKEATLANREALIEHHRRRLEEARQRTNFGDVVSDARVLRQPEGPAAIKEELRAVLERHDGH